MDNLTHSLVGLLCAEAVVRARERGARGPFSGFTRAAVYAFAIVGNNLPDLDFTYSSISGKTFGYLLQHRGYTHTLPAALGFALALLGIALLLVRRRKERLPAADWWLLAAVALTSPLLHIAMDFANNYGVHPFWPLDDGWFYGDSLFILEPALWLVVIAPLWLSYRPTWLRTLLCLVLGAALGLLWYRPGVPRGHAVALILLTVGLSALARKQSPAGRVILAGAGFALVCVSFVAGSRSAKAIVRERARLLFPAARTLDVVATPMPADPFCWSVLLLQREGKDYSVKLGRVSTFPAWLDVSECVFDHDATPTAPLSPVSIPTEAQIAFAGEYRAPVTDLQALASTRCEAQALLRFARVPYVTAVAADGSRVMGDLRYDRKRGLDFSDIRLTPTVGRCPAHVPPWRSPRTDILSGEN